jgi:hypothetical protein
MKELVVNLDELAERYKIQVEDLTDEFDNPTKVIEKQPRIVSERTNRVLHKFRETLSQIKKDSNYDLTMKRRRVFFQDMKTINEYPKQYQKLRKTQPELIEKAGDCSREEKEGLFFIRVAVSGKGKNLCRGEILEYLSHEYGHTVGKSLEQTFDEELKAYTFSSLVFRYSFGESPYKKTNFSYSQEVHMRALRELKKMLRAGAPEEMIMSHLIKERFGKYKPTDLFDFFK